jgi:hypothetical protein
MAVTFNASNANGLQITSDTSGQVVFQSNGANTVTVPNTGTGTVAVQGVSSNIVLGTAQNSTSGVTILFTGIPLWAKRITLTFSNVMTSGTSNIQAQIGSGSLTTTGYNGAGCSFAISGGFSGSVNSTGFQLGSKQSSSDKINGIMTLCLVTGSTWAATFITGGSTGSTTEVTGFGGGSVAISGTLDRVSVTTVNGTDTYNSGTIGIMWE